MLKLSSSRDLIGVCVRRLCETLGKKREICSSTEIPETASLTVEERLIRR